MHLGTDDTWYLISYTHIFGINMSERLKTQSKMHLADT